MEMTMAPDRRQFVGGLLPILAAGTVTAASPAATAHTVVSIVGNKFLVNGRPTYPGRAYQGSSVEGLLFVSLMVNAVVDDQNPQTRGVWAYADGP